MGQWEQGERIAWLDDSWLDDEIQEPKIEEVVQDIVEDDIEVLRREAEEMIAIEQAREELEMDLFNSDVKDQLIAEMEQDQAEDDEVEILKKQIEETIAMQDIIQEEID